MAIPNSNSNPLSRIPRESAQADFTFPITAVFGLSYRPTPKWNLEFDADYTDWGSFDNTTIYQQGDPAISGAAGHSH